MVSVTSTPAWRWLQRFAPFLPALLAPMAVFAPFLLGQQVLYWGTPLLQFYPWRALAVELVQQGQWPLWNPTLGNGAPLLANYQTAVFYPPNWLALLLPLAYAHSWLAVLHLIWAGVGMVLLARAWGLQPFGQALAGLAFGLSQYLVARVGFFSINAAVAWLPWVVLSTHQLFSFVPRSTSQPPRLRANLQSLVLPFLRLSLFIALQLLAGHAQTTWYTLLLAGAWLLWRGAWGLWVERTLTVRGFIQAALLFGAAGLFAGALTAVQLLPTAELMQQSPRATAADYDFVMTYSFSPWRLLTLLAPDLLGNPALGRYYGYGNYWEDAIYVGVLPLCLALGVFWAALWRRAPKNPVIPFLLLLLPLTFLLALGKNTPIFPFFYRYIPTFNLFQAPTRLMVLAVFALALLAAWGAQSWQPPQKWSLYWTRLGAAGAVSVTLIGAVGWWWAHNSLTAFGQQLQTVAQAVMSLGLLLFGAAILSLLKPMPSPLAAESHATRPVEGRTHLWYLAVMLVVALDLFYFNVTLNPGLDLALYAQPTQSAAALRPILQQHRLFQFPNDEYLLKFRRYLSFKTFGPPNLAALSREAQLPNSAMLAGLASANNFDPLLSARYTGFLDVISATQSTALLNLMDVAVVASVQPLPWPKIGQGDVVNFYQVPGTPTPLRIVYHAQLVVDLPTALAAVAAPTFNPAQSVVLESAPLARWLEPDPVFRPADWAHPMPGAITTTVTLDQPGWVVLSDTYYPGWVAWVDEQPTPILPANAAFRAVAVPAGTHRIALAYRPVSFTVGLWVTVVAGLVWLGLALWLFRKN